MRRLRTDEAGFTLIEMLVSCILGLIVLTALMGLMDTSQRVTTTVTERTDTTQRGRVAMERLVQGLRSQVCLVQAGVNPPAQITVTAASDSSVTFFTNVQAASDPGDPTLPTGKFEPQKWTYTFDGTKFTQTVQAGTVPANGIVFTNSGAPTTTTLLTNVLQKANAPVFTYYYYNADGNIVSTVDGTSTIPATTLATPVSATDLARIAQIEVNFTVTPFNNSSNPDTQASFRDAVTVRLPFPPPKSATENRTVQCSI